MIIEKINRQLSDYGIKRITSNGYKEVYDLQLSNPEYFAFLQDHEVTIEECIEGTNMLPPDTSQEQKFYLGFYRDDKLEVILDLILDYPSERILWIGLLMVDGSLKRRGYGRAVVQALINGLTGSVYDAIRLGVIESNIQAVSFWTSLKFAEISKCKIQRDDGNEIDIIVMERYI